MVDMGSKLKALRNENGLTQTLIKLSRMYHVTTDYLLGVKSKEMVDISDLSEEDKSVVKATISALRAKYTK